MNSLVKVFSNFKEFYSEINGATLTGAIDVIVVEQPDGEFQCSPFHVRFGKLGVLRSREKVVDIEINGEPVDIHMKLGDSGEAFFVEECPEEDVGELPENLATSPIPISYFPNKFVDDEDVRPVDENGKPKSASDEIPLPLPLPRRNSIDLSQETSKEEKAPIFENQVSDFSHRRYTDNTLERRNLSAKIKEYTTQKLRQEWAEHEEIFQFDTLDKEKDWSNSTQTEEKQLQQQQKIAGVISEPSEHHTTAVSNNTESAANATLITSEGQDASEPASCVITEPTASGVSLRDDGKGKKKRRKKSQMKKKNAQRKTSSSSSLCSNTPLETNTASGTPNPNDEAADMISISNHTTSSNDESAAPVAVGAAEVTPSVSLIDEPVIMVTGDESPMNDCGVTSPITPTTSATRIPDLDIHFFSDTEVTTSSGGNGPCGMGGRSGAGRPSTPIQSDSELEISMREKDADVELLSNSASWKWGELPTPEQHSEKNAGAGGQAAQSHAQRNSMLSGMLNFMKKTNKMRKQANDGGLYLSELDAEGMSPEMAAMYFPTPTSSVVRSSKDASTRSAMPEIMNSANDDDRESGNGTSLPHSPSSMEGQKSIDSDYEDGKPQDSKYLDFVAMSLCGGTEKGDPTDEQFNRHIVKYSDACKDPSLFASPNLVVRLNGKYYSWAAACPIVMTIITFQRPLTDDAIEQLMSNTKQDSTAEVSADKCEVDANTATVPSGQAKRSWWYWRRSQGVVADSAAACSSTSKTDDKNDDKVALSEADQAAAATQTTRPNSPDCSDNTLSKTDSTLNAENTSALVENIEDLSSSSSKTERNKNERFKKSLRLSSEAIKNLNLKDGINEIVFSVTTAYQGTTRCKCYLFRWKHNDKVVISDIDGTITRSDVLGHILPMVGKDWAQLGVAQLFSKIEQNGYKLLYLSARAIGQSRVTREYLRSIRQGDVKLPDGPLLLNPTSLISAFHREVIERKPEQFKIACLSDIRDLFPEKQPFYAGYGNRINDVWAYRAVGIPIMRIFTINTKGELKHELTQTFQSSGYINQSLEIDEYFPVLETAFEYRTDVYDDDEELDELKFSESDDGTNDDDDDEEEEDVFSDDYVDDNGVVVVDDEDGLRVDINDFMKHSKKR